MNIVEAERLRTLREITDDYYKVKKDADDYWDKIVGPEVEQCKTRDDLVELMGKIANQCSNSDTHMRDMPPGYSMRFMTALGRLPF